MPACAIVAVAAAPAVVQTGPVAGSAIVVAAAVAGGHIAGDPFLGVGV